LVVYIICFKDAWSNKYKKYGRSNMIEFFFSFFSFFTEGKTIIELYERYELNYK
jgi:hypothetical protein